MNYYHANFSDLSALGDVADASDLQNYADYMRRFLRATYPDADIHITTRPWEIDKVEHDGDCYDIEEIAYGFFDSEEANRAGSAT